jgi:putative ubiquitin-RnfH superfamily antitoxin RatB of RatAB toxin-antitoxin module
MDPAEPLQVEVVYCPQPGQVDQVRLRLAAGATLADAVQASGLLQRHALVAEGLRVGIWGKLREAGTLLRARDRIEIYRPLTVDPKEARRLRYKRNKAAATTP